MIHSQVLCNWLFCVHSYKSAIAVNIKEKNLKTLEKPVLPPSLKWRYIDSARPSAPHTTRI